MKRYKHKILGELWRNRPWRYIPTVVRFMREHPYTGGKNCHFRIWLRNALYLNWQVALKRREDA
jgi:hypothetical protein